MLILTAQDVRRALPLETAIAGMKHAFAALSRGDAVIPLRVRLPVASRNAAALLMPAYVPGADGDAQSDALAVKVVTLYPENIPAGRPLIHAAVLVMDARTGQMLALLEGSSLTAIRTGAASGAATDLLARPDARIAAIFGSGAQARTQLEAICAVRPLAEVRIYSRERAHARSFVEAMRPLVPVKLLEAASPREAMEGVDLICTATTSISPVFEDDHVPAGIHINGVGSYTPEMIEIPPLTIARALTVVDSLTACQAEAGEIIRAVALGGKAWAQVAELGAIINGTTPGRTSAEQITFFKSVGVAVQDAVAAQITLENAARLGLGQEVNW